jgi:outer membrane receptor protein involved in Fe transport
MKLGRSLLVSSLPWLLLFPVMAQEPEPAEEPPPVPEVEEVIVVTASRTEQRLHDAPATITVITGAELETAPVEGYGDILRNVAGVNVSQTSARDIQVTSRAATSSLASSQLVLMDGRTLYLDFFGFVMWDFLPVNVREIEQIEVVQGPGSAVWGANAMTGVINVITKRPRDMVGTSVTLGAGSRGTLFGSLTQAGVSGNVGYKVSAGYFEQDPYDRPTGVIPDTGTPYPPFQNQGTQQPKLDFRVDYDPTIDTTWSFSGGYAGTDGIIHTGIGPFDIDSGSYMGYGRASWTRRALQASFFANILRGDAQNLLTVGADGRPVDLGFDSETYNIDVSNTSIIADQHLLTYGANARRSNFDLTIAPGADKRDEIGAYLQGEIALGHRARWVLGGRWDDVDPIGSVFSPRTSLIFNVTPRHTLRASYNRAFKAPSLIHNHLNIVIVNIAPLPTGPYVFPSLAHGNPDLNEERMDAFELGYVGTFGPQLNLTASLYRNKSRDSQKFHASQFYTAANPPPGFPLPPFVLNIPPPQGLAGVLPSHFTYRNIGEVINRGLEVGLSGRPGVWRWSASYAWQDEPDPTGITLAEINLPPTHTLNLSLGYSGERYFAGTQINYQDEARWTDVLDARFHGTTDSFTQVNANFGVHLLEDRLTLSVTGQNIFDERVQQHIFGDIIGRKVVGQASIHF